MVDIDPARDEWVVTHLFEVVYSLTDLAPDVSVVITRGSKTGAEGGGDGDSTDSLDEVSMDEGVGGEWHDP